MSSPRSLAIRPGGGRGFCAACAGLFTYNKLRNKKGGVNELGELRSNSVLLLFNEKACKLQNIKIAK
jgi:hypothetical protein